MAVFCCLVSLIATTGCRETDRYVYSEFAEIGDDGWDPVRTISFSPMPFDSASSAGLPLQVILYVRYDSECHNSMLPVLVEQEMREMPFRRDSVFIKLFDSEGRHTGHGTLGVYEKSVVINEAVVIDSVYRVNLRPLLNKEDSRGILSAGVALRRQPRPGERENILHRIISGD